MFKGFSYGLIEGLAIVKRLQKQPLGTGHVESTRTAHKPTKKRE